MTSSLPPADTPTTPPAPAEVPPAWRWRVYVLLITVAAGMILGRLLSVELIYEPSYHRESGQPRSLGRTWPTERPEPMPTFSSNDRSRWCTVRALVENGTYVIGHRDPNYLGPAYLVTQVLGAKALVPVGGPLAPLAPILVASRVTQFDVFVLPHHPKPATRYGDHGIVFEDGWQTVDKILDPKTREFYSTKPPLVPTLLAGEYWVLHRLFGWSITQDRWLVIRTILVTWNALPWVLYLLVLAWLVERVGTTDWGRFYVVAAGCFATLLTPFLISLNNHTIAACFAAFTLYFAARIYLDRAGWWAFALAGLCAGFTACNELPAASFAALLGLVLLWRFPRQTLLAYVPAVLLVAGAALLTNYLALGDWRPAYSKFGGPWYEYEGSHWQQEGALFRSGIDFAWQWEDRWAYAFHLLLGHHGLISLTPLYLFALVGMGLALVGRGPVKEGTPALRPLWRGFALFSLVLTLVVVGFYLLRSNNYGGWTCGPRWLLWLTPLWLGCMVPVLDWLGARRWGRGLALAGLALSILSVAYALRNPWRHPWIFNLMDALGGIPY
jgi:hypothetical protein